ncbi:tetratricopeptide repeat protein, partial [Bacteroidota bacterium]
NELKAEAHFIMGEANYYKDVNDLAILHYKKAITFTKKNSNTYINSLLKLGQTFYYNIEYDSSLVYLNAAKHAAFQENNTEIICKSYEALGRVYRKINEYQKAILVLDSAIIHNEKLNSIDRYANIYNQIGLIYYLITDYKQAVSNYNESIKYYEETGDKEGEAIVFNNLGNVYTNWGDFEKAIEYFQKALVLFENLNHKEGVANCYSNIALCYENLIEESLLEENLKNYKNALNYHRQALDIRKELGDIYSISISYENLGNVYSRITSEKLEIKYGRYWEDSIAGSYDPIRLGFDTARQYYEDAYKIKLKIEDVSGLASLLNNFGRLFSQMGSYELAYQKLDSSLTISKEIDNKYLTALNLREIARNYLRQKKYSNALSYYFSSLEISKQYNFKYLSRYTYQDISEIYKTLGDYKKSLNYYELFVQIKDSITNEEKYKQISQLETIYEIDKKQKEIEILNKDKALKEATIKQQRRTILIILGAILIIVLILIQLFKLYRDKRKANKILQHQNEIISEQKESITDSIQYASKIQTALLPQNKDIDHLIPAYFILFKPRDIVSGDFYWIREQNNKIIVVAADCTGHGVPGAFMSMLGIAYLTEITNKFRSASSNIILDELRTNVISSLHQKEDEEGSKDGMDLVLTIIDFQNMKLDYTGAYNPLVIIRNGDILEFKANRMPIGIYVKSDLPFQNTVVDLQKNDMVYMFSDGFQDQFGGENGKKYMYKNMKQDFVEIYEKDLEEQKQILDDKLTAWRGERHQVDDVVLIGIRV